MIVAIDKNRPLTKARSATQDRQHKTKSPWLMSGVANMQELVRGEVVASLESATTNT